MPKAFRNASRRSIYVDDPLEAEPVVKKTGTNETRIAAQKKDPPNRARKIFPGAIGEPDAGGWVNLAGVGHRVQGEHPDFDPRSNVCMNLGTQVENSGVFDILRPSMSGARARRQRT